MLLLAALLFTGGAAEGQNPDLSSLSVDDLMNVSVVSVAMKEQKLADTAAAAFVITQEEIARSGATSLPEVLRLVPGLDVARINGNSWAISARGSNGLYANKLLVLIDGRTLYTPLFSGVFWDVQDMLLEDVERIEVIRGPGGSLWGANAINGIINIITKHAISTHGMMVSAGAASAGGTTGAARYGGMLGQNAHYRVYGKSFDRPPTRGGRSPSDDALSLERGGFRADWNSRRGDTFILAADLYQGGATALGLIDPQDPFAPLTALNRLRGGNGQFQWSATQSVRSDTTLRVFYDTAARSQPSVLLTQRTLDADFHHHLKLGLHEVTWGAGYRRSADALGGYGAALVRDSGRSSIASGFLQEQVRLRPRLHLTLGIKALYDSRTDLALQPTVRLLFNISPRQTLWSAVTSAVRTPSSLELYGRVNLAAFPDGNGHNIFTRIVGNPTLQAERVTTFEAGYRGQTASGLSFDATLFHTRMRDLIDTRIAAPFVDAGALVFPVELVNGVKTRAVGGELYFTQALGPGWQMTAGYTYFGQTLVAGDLPPSASFAHPSVPKHQAQLRSFFKLPARLELDTAAYYTGAIGREVDSYVRFDQFIRWHGAGAWEWSVGATNLLEPEHREFAGVTGEDAAATPTRRSIVGKITWRR
jgi:iron complex outermembrane receptor protein